MFMINEIEKILSSFVTSKKSKNPIRITLPDVNRIDVGQMKFESKLRYPSEPLISGRQTGASKVKLGVPVISRKLIENKNLTNLDKVFLEIMDNSMLPRLISDDHQSSSVKILVCDDQSYNLVMKLKRILSKSDASDSKYSNFLHKSPFNMSAILLLTEMLDLFDRQQKPLLFKRYNPNTGKPLYIFNYDLVRQSFPYLKMSDLYILSKEKAQFDVNTIDPSQSNRIQLTVRLLQQFAHSTNWIELNSIDKLLCQIHPNYDNVIVFNGVTSTTNQFDKTATGSSQLLYRMPNSDMLLMVEQFVHFLDKLKLRPTSISFKAGDSHVQSKTVARLIATNLATRQPKPDEIWTGARVLVLDRLCSIAGPLFHADKYGAFLEQENLFERVRDDVNLPINLVSSNELDDKLQLTLLSQVLSVIIKFTLDIRPHRGVHGQTTPTNDDLARYKASHISSALTSSQSVSRHLDIVKYLYECLYDGYLLILRLESSLIALNDDIAKLQSTDTCETVIARLERILVALNQLTANGSRSIRSMDLIRLACIIVDLINRFFALLKRGKNTKAAESVTQLKRQLVEVDFRKMLKSIRNASDDKSWSTEDLLKTLNSFDALSSGLDNHNTASQIHADIMEFASGDTDPDLYSSTVLNDTSQVNQAIILLFMCSLTAHELSLIKSLETEIKQQKGAEDVYILMRGIAEPCDFVRALR